MGLEEAQKFLYAEGRKIEASKRQIEAYQRLYERVFGERGVVLVAQRALENCDHSDTGISHSAAVTAYTLGERLKNLYETASKILPRKIREAFYVGLNRARYDAKVALATARKHLSTLKQRPRLEKLLQTYRMAAGI